MSFRFQKRIKIAPGIRLNVSKSGVSTSIGGRGATVNLSSRGVRTTVGIPGTGLSWSNQTGWSDSKPLKPKEELRQIASFLGNLQNKFNTLSPKANAASKAWNKAVDSFQGGRGPSASKLNTLSKRFETATKAFDKVDDQIVEYDEALNAAIHRLNSIRLGFFSRALKPAQLDLIKTTERHKSAVTELKGALLGLRTELDQEFHTAHLAVSEKQS